jgi:hypothetical protein
VVVHVPVSAHEVPRVATAVALVAAWAQPRFALRPDVCRARRRGALVGIFAQLVFGDVSVPEQLRQEHLELRDDLDGTMLFAACPRPGCPRAEGEGGVIAVRSG